MAASRHIRGLDGLRFVMALWVVFGHVGFVPLPPTLERGVVRGLYHGFENGAAAVMVFFVISGFCIHYPYRRQNAVGLLHFYSRRHIRILLPIVAAVLIARPLGISLNLLTDSILWSLLCEEIYYTIYPLLLKVRARTGWPVLIVAAYVIAYAIIVLRPRPAESLYPIYGWQLNWLVGLPCWLLGAHLAETTHLEDTILNAPSRGAIMAWRTGAFMLGAVGSNYLRFHFPLRIPSAASLDVFALYVFFWLRAEIRRAEAGASLPIERLGVFSYSMYLVHPQANELFLRVVPGAPLGALGTWFARILWILLFSLVFYRLVEKPAHSLARRVAQRLLARHAQVPAT